MFEDISTPYRIGKYCYLSICLEIGKEYVSGLAILGRFVMGSIYTIRLPLVPGSLDWEFNTSRDLRSSLFK